MANWIGIDSSHLYNICGEDSGFALADALDGTDYWRHSQNHVHGFILDLGQTHLVKKVRARSNLDWDPLAVAVYVSDIIGDWGTAVASGAPIGWHDTDTFVETECVDKEGRYIYVVILTTEDSVNKYLSFGKDTPFTIFDVYSSVLLAGQSDIGISTSGNLSRKRCLSGSSAISITASANLINAVHISGSSSIGITATANLTVKVVFPSLSTSPNMEGFVDEYSDETVIVDSYASGYPLIIPQFTFDLKNFLFILRHVSQADKELLMMFYNAKKESILLWHNEQDNKNYYVIFIHKPDCRLDSEKDEWRIEIGFKQVQET